ncbi:MAG TPA: methyltransferase domain-containing protein [Bryobacteraceae bacterium]|nr:methyltransferase domain-containing protein [Bryobacteraceae bacterium]
MPDISPNAAPPKNGSIHEHLAYRLFFQESLRTIRITAALLPSSRFLTTAMLEQVDFRNVRTLVELGSGTGVITREILRRMSQDSRLFTLEINRKFVRHLRTHCQDRRLTVVQADAADLPHQLRLHNVGPVHAIVSSLGLTGMTPSQRARILQAAEACLAPAGVMTQFQYLQAPMPDWPNVPIRRFEEKMFLESYFSRVSTKRVLLNLPPAMVFTCRK